MKSQASVVLHVLDGLFTDARLAYPELKESFLLDKERIALNFEKRGLSLFTLDLPSLETLLLKGLEVGRLSLEGPLSRRVSKRIHVPRLFSGLWLRVFHRDSCLREEPDITAVAFLRQFLVLGKKIEVECSRERIAASLKGFFDVESGTRLPTLGWDDDNLFVNYEANHLHFARDISHNFRQRSEDSQPVVTKRDRQLLTQLQHVADVMSRLLGTFDPITYSSDLESDSKGFGMRHGPGAVAEGIKSENKSRFKAWPLKLERTFHYSLFGKTIGDSSTCTLNHEVPSRLICVPKTAKGPRLIAAEPVAHQWCQQLMRYWFDQRLMDEFLGSFINFRRQDLSGRLVIQASLDRKLATVDLSDASDRLSCWTVERMFRCNPSILNSLHAARTRWLSQNISESQDSFIKLKKFASQGTAVTFPVQSIVFLVIALTSIMSAGVVTKERIMKYHKSCRVFGDDIIIPKTGYARLVRIMDLLGLKVNTAKSYVDGHFRESCGVDGFMGYDVTPVKPKTFVADGPASCQAVIDTTNNLFNKGYWHASNNLLTTVPVHVKRGLRVVARTDAGFSGLTSYSGSDESHLKHRWNSRLHRYEGRIWTSFPKTSKRDTEGFHVLLEFCSRSYDMVNPRVASIIRETRKTCSGLLWEPLNSGALGYPGAPDTIPNRCDSKLREPSRQPGRVFPDRGWCEDLEKHCRTLSRSRVRVPLDGRT